MPNNQIPAVNTPMIKQAEEQARKYIENFATSLILQAKIIAYHGANEMVLTNHIDEALEAISKEKKQSWSHEMFITLGGAFIGAFIQGFISELSNGNRLLIAIYTILGFIGMLMVFWGLHR